MTRKRFEPTDEAWALYAKALETEVAGPPPPLEEVLWERLEELERRVAQLESHRHVIGDGMINGRYEKFATGEPIGPREER
ncbi:hypothetical protein SEA_YEET_160 [Mycobacterium phage Yeet]|uniref:Uncharacterized protein n=4 Tax=Omegavirus TaxID=1623292 RepID=A0A3S9UB51_9CAUD|nr:hypothetical protein N860_gp162 [Mycobacterium phage Redno2]YP_009018163.1 hypothetical protein CL87_gp152 [Mycobacterium phage Thibault]YP_009124121.1 hypothetical protein VC71_gp168 [Mycobacterium phage Minerva]YP_009591023.1 hypothetical protein FDG54_gp167 [Mycobacterium phage Optimus]YP_009636345.1 hypothetical protein FGG20_gp174 [Mycobacterium phage Baka]AWH13979.1 hypothetical protein SEA_HALLEY_169 [Mycobacterium phage Halley]AXF51654.1 hypothetical protein CONSTELLA_164 [Mycobact